MGKLITPSILDSYDWYVNCPAHFKTSAFQQISDALNRKPWDPTPAILRGMAFEKMVCANLDDISKEDFMLKFEGHCKDMEKFWARCRNGRQQAKVSKTITVDGVEYYLYGKRDIAFSDVTIDIKTTGDYKGPQYYTSKNQHVLYIACSEIEQFMYMIAEYDDVKEKCVAVYEVNADLKTEVALARIESKIREFISFLKTDDELMEAYNKTFCRSW